MISQPNDQILEGSFSRRQILQQNIRWKALDEIHKIYMLCTAQTPIFQKFQHRQFVFAFATLEMLNSLHFSNLVASFADFSEICSEFLRFSRKTLQQLDIPRSQFHFSMIIPEIHLIFDLIFDLILFNFV